MWRKKNCPYKTGQFTDEINSAELMFIPAAVDAAEAPT
jgi:hypothetical protein